LRRRLPVLYARIANSSTGFPKEAIERYLARRFIWLFFKCSIQDRIAEHPARDKRERMAT
jgi:hypothetical protein